MCFFNLIICTTALEKENKKIQQNLKLLQEVIAFCQFFSYASSTIITLDLHLEEQREHRTIS